MPRGGRAESYGRSILGFLRNFYIKCHADYTSLYSHQPPVCVPHFVHLRPAFVIFSSFLSLFFFSLNLAILTRVRGNPLAVLIFISPMAKFFEHFLNVSQSFVSSFKNSIFKLSFYFLDCGCSLYILDINPLLDGWLAEAFQPFCKLPLPIAKHVLCNAEDF